VGFLNQHHALDKCNVRAKREQIENTRVSDASSSHSDREFTKLHEDAALKHGNLLSRMSEPIAVQVFGPRAFCDLIWLQLREKQRHHKNEKTGRRERPVGV
jgi:hypothetical protein